MASTNKTSNLQLSQFIATDTPTWLVDYNGDMEKIDAGVGRVEELAETASTQAVGVASGLQTTNQTVTTLSGQVANVQNQANTTTASVNGINQRLGNADISGIGDGTITGAISMQNGKLNNYQNIESNLIWEAGLQQSNVTAYKNGREVFISFQCKVTINSGTVITIFKVPYTIKADVYQPMTVSDGVGTPLGSCNGIMAKDSYFKIASPINGGYVSGTVQFLIDE